MGDQSMPPASVVSACAYNSGELFRRDRVQMRPSRSLWESSCGLVLIAVRGWLDLWFDQEEAGFLSHTSLGVAVRGRVVVCPSFCVFSPVRRYLENSSYLHEEHIKQIEDLHRHKGSRDSPCGIYPIVASIPIRRAISIILANASLDCRAP